MNIITHNGIFHADEIFAIAIIQKAFDVKTVIRTREESIIKNGLSDSNTFVLDVGGQYNADILAFDHHQDKNLKSSAGLIWEHLKDVISNGNVSVANMIEKDLINAIDMWDVNSDFIHQQFNEFNTFGMMNLSQIIKGYNRNPSNEEEQMKQFNLALDVAKNVLDNSLNIALEHAKSVDVWNNRKTLKNGVLVFSEYCHVWRAMVKELNLETKFAVMPNPSGYMINALDAKENPIPEISHEDLKFLHNGKFLAVFNSKKGALEAAESL